MADVLHIAPHLGAGVGRVLRNTIDEFSRQGPTDHSHSIVCFETANASARKWGLEAGVAIAGSVWPESDSLSRRVSDADIVHVHFWNHPLTYRFLVSGALPEHRSVMWAYINGHDAPQLIPRGVLAYPDIFVFSTAYSEEMPGGLHVGQEGKKVDIRTVFMSSGYGHVRNTDRVPHAAFNIGYLGTVDYCKLHRDYVKLCSQVQIPGVKFVVCGGDQHAQLQLEVDGAGLSDRFTIKGPVQDVCAEYATFDLFGYPLAPGHYGTGEQVLIEAMACGVVPVVLDNGPERYIVKDGRTGVVAKTGAEYVKAIESLYADANRRIQMGSNARRYVRENYGVEKTVTAWRNIYRDVLKLPRRKRSPAFEVRSSDDPGLELFLHSLGDSPEAAVYRQALRSSDADARRSLACLPPIFTSPTRGSAFHYLQYWRQSVGLKTLCRLHGGGTSITDPEP